MGLFRKQINDWGDMEWDWQNIFILIAIIIGLVAILKT